MSLLRRVDVMELDPLCPHFPFLADTSIFAPRTPLAFPPFLEDHLDLCFALDHLSPQPEAFEFFDALTDLIQAEKPAPALAWSYRRFPRPVGADTCLQALSDRVEALGSKFGRLLTAGRTGCRKYTWSADVEGRHADRKYKWVAKVRPGKEVKKHHHQINHHHHNLNGVKSYKWTAEIKEKGEDGPIKRTYTWKSSTADVADHCRSLQGKKNKGGSTTRLVEIEELNNHGAVFPRQAFAKRTGVTQRAKGRKEELSPQDAASMIQMSFKAYLVRRSQALRALREMAVAKAKLKEFRSLFNNFSYRRQIAHDSEERQRFAEKIIVVLLTVDAMEAVDLMVRAAKKSMVDELEAMLDVVDPQPLGKYLSAKRRRMFDVPDGLPKKETAMGLPRLRGCLIRKRKAHPPHLRSNNVSKVCVSIFCCRSGDNAALLLRTIFVLCEFHFESQGRSFEKSTTTTSEV